MLSAITLTFFFQVVGEIICRSTGIPVPGPVIGMVLMLLAFFIKDNLIDTIRPTAGVLLANLSLLFVPAGVGIMRHGERFAEEGVAIVAILIITTVLSMLVPAWTFLFIQKKFHLTEEDQPE